MPNFPLGVDSGDLIVFNPASQIWERGTASAGTPNVAIFPNFDADTEASAPQLVYKVFVNDDLGSFTILGRNLDDIVAVSFQDVKVGGNTSPAPIVGSLTVASNSIIVPADATDTTTDDYWGVLCTDSQGNVFAAPSPLRIVTGA